MYKSLVLKRSLPRLIRDLVLCSLSVCKEWAKTTFYWWTMFFYYSYIGRSTSIDIVSSQRISFFFFPSFFFFAFFAGRKYFQNCQHTPPFSYRMHPISCVYQPPFTPLLVSQWNTEFYDVYFTACKSSKNTQQKERHINFSHRFHSTRKKQS